MKIARLQRNFTQRLMVNGKPRERVSRDEAEL